jgi:outer membrane protein OmpA-like peptidoglycan-associated protein
MKFRNVLLATAVMALPIAASAQPVTGLYIGAGAGIDLHAQEAIKNLSVGSGVLGGLSTSGNTKFNVGFAGQMSLGYGFGNGFRVEGEGDYFSSKTSGFTGGKVPISGGGTEQKYGFMGNVLYDFVGLVPMVQPYVGAGVGMQWVNWSNFRASNIGTFGFNGVTVAPGGLSASSNGNSKAVFAYQAIVGVAVPVTSVPGLALTAEYRFVGTTGNRSTDATFTGTTTKGVSVAAPGKIQYGPTYDNVIMFGIRYNFDQAPPPAAPMPVADTGAKTFLVFFDWNKADLTGRSQEIVRDAAGYATKTQYTRIDVDGNTDTTGTPTYNQGLSERRARIVAAELVRDGVPQSAISLHAYGETKLLVPTGPNVREPQNRRVDIVYH